MANCTYKRCKRCCVISETPCAIHLAARQEEIELLKLHHGIIDVKEDFPEISSQRKIIPYKGDFAENSFKYFGDTTTIFCIQDFLCNSSYCMETMQAERRKKKSRSASAAVGVEAGRQKKRKRVDGEGNGNPSSVVA